MNLTATISTPQLHVRYNGQSYDFDMTNMDLGTTPTDQEVVAAASRELNIPAAKFAGYAVDRNPTTGDVTLRPDAIYG